MAGGAGPQDTAGLPMLRPPFVLLVVFASSACHLLPGGRADGDGHWQFVRTPTRQSLRGLGALDAATVWVSGAGGEVWRSRDGGESWQAVAPPNAAACDFRDLEVLDADHALVLSAGDVARVDRTTDGGATWRTVLTDTRRGAFFDAMAFTGDHGVLFADPMNGGFCLWTTRDRGATWQPVARDRLPAPLVGEAAFAASGTCVAAFAGPSGPEFVVATGGGERARVLQGAFGSWRVVDAPMHAGAPSRGGFGLAFAGDHGVVVGGDYAVPTANEGTVARSDDGGRTWQPVAAGAGGFRSAVVWLDDARLLAVGSHGTSVSDDRGRSWRVVDVEGFHALSRAADGTVWAAGADGRVARWVPRR